MKISGSATVAAPLAVVWDALQDPQVLVRTIPGCLRLETTGPDTYAMTVSAGVASIKGTYVGEVSLHDPEPPRSFVLRARGQGAPGTVDATVQVSLSDGDQGGTAIDYAADAVVGGMIGGVGQRMLGTVAKRTAAEFFTAVEDTLREPPPPPPLSPALTGAGEVGAPRTGPAVEDGSPAGTPEKRPPAGAVYTAPARGPGAAPTAGASGWPMVAAFAAGGSVALAGVAVGYLLGRRSSR